MDFRTDLTLERREILGKNTPEGVHYECEEKRGARITRIQVTDSDSAKAIGKPVGKYITVEVEPFFRQAQLIDSGGLEALIDELRDIFPKQGHVLVAGLGNVKITPDAFGPKCASMLLPTRHIEAELAKSLGLGELRCVSAFCAGVLGETGIESAEAIAGIVSKIKPDMVIAVDALAAREVSRLGCTVQISNTGIIPGSGVGNSRALIDSTVLGVPVFSLGVPTVINASALGSGDGECGDMVVTPREIDLLIERASKFSALALNCAFQPHLSAEDILILTA